MQRHHTGSGRRSVIPADWTEHHVLAANGTHTATVEIRPPGTTRTFDEDTGQTKTTPPDPTYEGPAGVTPAASPSAIVTAADDQVAINRYVVTIPQATTGITAEHRVKITACSEPALSGRTLQVSAIAHDAVGFELVLHCTLND